MNERERQREIEAIKVSPRLFNALLASAPMHIEALVMVYAGGVRDFADEHAPAALCDCGGSAR